MFVYAGAQDRKERRSDAESLGGPRTWVMAAVREDVLSNTTWPVAAFPAPHPPAHLVSRAPLHLPPSAAQLKKTVDFSRVPPRGETFAVPKDVPGPGAYEPQFVASGFAGARPPLRPRLDD